jgi:Ca-activated chloride channel family protein
VPPGPSAYPYPPTSASAYPPASYQDPGRNPQTDALQDNRSTFALDVDTASYTIARNYLRNGVLPDAASVRTEEFVNFFAQDFSPTTERGLSIRADGASVPFLGADHRVVRVGVVGQSVDPGERKPASITVVVDTSGSMADRNKLDLVKAGLHRLVRSLRSDDTVEIVSFSSQAGVVVDRTRVTAGGESRLDDAIDSLRPQDSTNLEAGLALGYDEARAAFRPGTINRVVLATDGVANTGRTEADAILQRVSEEAGQDIQMVAIGVGFGNYNDVLMEQLADRGDGFYAYVDQPAESERLFAEQLTTTLQTVALDGKAEVRFNPQVVQTYRLLGYEDRAIPDGSIADPRIGGGALGAGHVTTALYDVQLLGGAERDGRVRPGATLATVSVHWTDPDGHDGKDRSHDITVADVSGRFEQSPVRLRQDVWVAAFAERLRGGGWDGQVQLGEIAEGVDGLAGPLESDADVTELARLVHTAAALRA